VSLTWENYNLFLGRAQIHENNEDEYNEVMKVILPPELIFPTDTDTNIRHSQPRIRLVWFGGHQGGSKGAHLAAPLSNKYNSAQVEPKLILFFGKETATGYNFIELNVVHFPRFTDTSFFAL
jgi:hypothetical protein